MEIRDFFKHDWKKIQKHILILMIISWVIGVVLGTYMKSSPLIWWNLNYPLSILYFIIFSIAIPSIYAYFFVRSDEPLRNVILISIIFTILMGSIYIIFNTHIYVPVLVDSYKNDLPEPVLLEVVESMLATNPASTLSWLLYDNICKRDRSEICSVISTVGLLILSMLIHLGSFLLGYSLKKKLKRMPSGSSEEGK